MFTDIALFVFIYAARKRRRKQIKYTDRSIVQKLTFASCKISVALVSLQYEETLKPTYINVDLSEVELAEYDGPLHPLNNSLLLDVSILNNYLIIILSAFSFFILVCRYTVEARHD